jgi:hypothetical protein
VSNADFKPKWIKWDEDAFRADTIVRRMNNTQRAFYRCLLMECYMGPLRPYLPDDDEELWMLAEAENIAHWQEHKALILKKFSKVTGSDGAKLLQNKRVMEEWEDLAKMLAAKSRAGSASVAARRAQATPTPAPVQQPLPAAPEPAAAPEQTRPEKIRKEEKREEENRIVCSTPANKCSTPVDESSKPAPLSSNSKSEANPAGGQVTKLLRLAMRTARRAAEDAKFTGKGTQLLRAAIEEVFPTEDQLVKYVLKEVGNMDVVERTHCGNNLASNMHVALEIQREEETQRVQGEQAVAEGVKARQADAYAKSEAARREEALAAQLGDSPF